MSTLEGRISLEEPDSSSRLGKPMDEIMKSRFFLITSMDLRSLAAFRIGLGAMCLFDLMRRSADLTAHYTDAGVLPRWLAAADFVQPLWSLYMSTGTTVGVATLFILHGLLAAALMLGWHSRLCAAGTWLLFISLHSRNPLVGHGGDVYLRMLLFWAMFLPLEGRHQENTRHPERSEGSPNRYWSMGTVALLSQVLFVYLFAALSKSGEDWRETGLAVYYALHNSHMLNPLGAWLQQFEALHPILSFSTLALEFLCPLLLVSPFAFARCRILGLLALAMLHVGLGLSLVLGTFSPICLVALLPLIPSEVWDRGKVAMPKSKALPCTGAWRAKTAVANAAAGAMLIFALIWNFHVRGDFGIVLPEPVKNFAFAFRLDQGWTMFSPNVFKEDGWYVMPGEKVSGEAVDAFAGIAKTPAQTELPKVSPYPNDRWMKYMMSLYEGDHRKYLGYLSTYLCKSWNEGTPRSEMLRKFDIRYQLRLTPPPGEAPKGELLSLWVAECREPKAELLSH